MSNREFNAYISQKISVSPEIIILRIVPDGWDLPEFDPGQYAVLGLPGSAPRVELSDADESPVDPDKFILRAYSVASASRQKEYLELYVTLVRSGALTPRLFALNPGDKIHLAPKIKGVFTINELPSDLNLVLMGTGTGLAPYMSMIRSCIRPGEKRKFAVVHGARHSWDLGYRSELMTIRNITDNLAYIPIISRPKLEMVPWAGEVGYVQQVWDRNLISDQWGFQPTPENTHVFLCGNPGMIESAVTLLASHGFKEHSKRSPGEVHLEKYW
ncbi:MAG: ferredoxin--NADP reductase [Candidatus Marinimicrobia bacterium]|nr:ferredoxin--NADP reductase [Candidatus Neomarinimicrobiota bacterium]